MTLDTKMPFLETLLEPHYMQERLSKALDKDLKLVQTLLLRHKKGKRCLIEYELQDRQSGETFSLLAKARAKGLDRQSFKLQNTLWLHGFSDSSPDFISVPEVLTCLPELNCFLQRKLPGQNLGDHLNNAKSLSMMAQAARGLAKLQQSSLELKRSHTLDDELEILENRLQLASEVLPHLKARITGVMLGCEILANQLPPVPSQTLHRDFYQDQLIFHDKRLYLLDFDLMAKGQPALDAGNFLAHLSEYGLRTGDITRFSEHEKLFLNSYLAHTNPELRPSIEIYKTLSLARHIYISSLFESRQAFSENILELCEQRLGIHHLKPSREHKPRHMAFLNQIRLF